MHINRCGQKKWFAHLNFNLQCVAESGDCCARHSGHSIRIDMGEPESIHDQYPSVMKYYVIECFERSAHVLNETNGIFAYTTPIGTCLSFFLLDHDTFAVVLLEFFFHTATVGLVRSL